MRIACVGYRQWALRIYDRLACQTDHQFLIIRSQAQYDEQALYDFRPDIVLFYGWSWKVSTDLVTRFSCIMLHPAPLPKYRGGSPLQNQIIRGEQVSMVTLFLMDQNIDSGPVLAVQTLSLAGDIEDILERITTAGIDLTLKLLLDGLHPIPQVNENATFYSRRTPEESEITIDEITNSTAEYLYNKIRMLQSPYPNAFIKTADGKKLLIFRSQVSD